MNDTWGTTESAFDVAAALIQGWPEIDQMQLHKLLYLTQAASLAWFDKTLFGEEIEAWKWGPVVRGVAGHYMQYDNEAIKHPESGDPRNLSAQSIGVIERVLSEYSGLSGPALASLVKAPGSPWRQARGDIPLDATSRARITPEVMRAYHRTHGVTPVEPTPDVLDLAKRFLDGDRDSLADLMELATGSRPRLN